ncbi:MAG: CBS domain-containing protein [Desulfobacterales bacterium]|nr:CBS domain-containing protein [Desulfobacterales bacterium]
MKQFTVKDLMVPISEYATVPEGSTVLDAIVALEKAQEDFAHTRYSHRAVLILGKDKRVVGKLSQFDFLRSLEPGGEQAAVLADIDKFGFSAKAVALQREQYRLQEVPLAEIFQDAAKLKVEEFMQTPAESEFIEAKTSLHTAIHQMIIDPTLSLLVVEKQEIVGILRLSDVFGAVFHTMKKSVEAK